VYFNLKYTWRNSLKISEPFGDKRFLVTFWRGKK